MFRLLSVWRALATGITSLRQSMATHHFAFIHIFLSACVRAFVHRIRFSFFSLFFLHQIFARFSFRFILRSSSMPYFITLSRKCELEHRPGVVDKQFKWIDVRSMFALTHRLNGVEKSRANRREREIHTIVFPCALILSVEKMLSIRVHVTFEHFHQFIRRLSRARRWRYGSFILRHCYYLFIKIALLKALFLLHFYDTRSTRNDLKYPFDLFRLPIRSLQWFRFGCVTSLLLFLCFFFLSFVFILFFVSVFTFISWIMCENVCRCLLSI